MSYDALSYVETCLYIQNIPLCLVMYIQEIPKNKLGIKPGRQITV